MKDICEILSWRTIIGSHRLMVLIVMTLGLFNVFFGERVVAGGGFGWDGVLYADMVRNLDEMIRQGLLSNYYAQRFLPSAVVRGMILLSGCQLSAPNIIRGFELYNMALLMGTCWIWRRLADNFSISLAGRWIGFGGLFLSFNCSKAILFSPVNTDVTALFIGMLLLLFYVEKRPVVLLMTAILGAFAWPVVSLCGALLLLFLKTEIPKGAIPPSSFFISTKLTRLIKLGWINLLVASVAGFAAILGIESLVGVECSRTLYLKAAQKLLTSLPSIAGVGIMLSMLFGSVLFARTVVISLPQTNLFLVMLSIMALLVPWGIVHAIANPSLWNAGSFLATLHACLFPPWGKFLLPFVSLSVFWGPIVLLGLLEWRRFCTEARKMGPGFVAVVGLSLPLALATEPRFITCAWPFLVFGVVRAMEHTDKKKSFKYVYSALTILFAQFWLKINLAPWSAGDYADLDKFPKQFLFMHYGLWMGWWAYGGQLGLVVLCIVWLEKLVRPVGPVVTD